MLRLWIRLGPISVPTDVQDLIHEAEWRKCATDARYFLENYYFITHPERGRILFELREAQDEILEVLESDKRIIILKARQIGFTTLLMGYVFWLAFFHDDRQVIVLSRTERLAVEALSRCKYAYRFLPDWMRDRGPEATADNQLVMPFSNGSAVESYPSQKDPARGRTVYMIVCDEFASLDDQESAWAAIEPTTDIGGRVVLLSTAKGAGDLFEHFWNGAENGTNGFSPIFYPWSAVPERDAAWYATKQREYDGREHILHQEYPTTAQEAFVRAGNAVFDTNLLLELRDAAVAPRVGKLVRVNHSGQGGTYNYVDAAGGELQVWELPDRGHRYVMGVDVAEGLAHGDYSVAWVIDVNSSKAVAKWRGHIAPDLLGKDICWALGWYYNRAFIGVEVNNHGLTTAMALRDKSYPNLYWRTRYDTRSKAKSGSQLGWYTSISSKADLIDSLRAAVREDLILLDRETVGEMLTYVYDENGRMGGSPYDDQVMALGVANIMRRHVSQAEWNVETTMEGSWGWLEKYLLDDGKDNRQIGVHNVRH